MTALNFSRVNKLTPRQFAVLRELGRGETMKEIAFTLNISYSAAIGRLERIKYRLNIDTVERARAFATRFVVFTETTRFKHAYPDGQAELEFDHECTEQ